MPKRVIVESEEARDVAALDLFRPLRLSHYLGGVVGRGQRREPERRPEVQREREEHIIESSCGRGFGYSR